MSYCEKGVILLADYDAQSSKSISKQGRRSRTPPYVFKDDDIEIESLEGSVEHENHESVDPLEQTIWLTAEVKTSHGDMDFEHLTNARTVSSSLEDITSSKFPDEGHSNFKDEIETAVNDIIDESINSYRGDIKEAAKSFHQWDGSWEKSEEVLQNIPHTESDLCDQSYKTETAEKVLEAEYTRDKHAKQLKNMEDPEAKSSSIGANEPYHGREVCEATQSYGSRADFLGALIQSGVDDNLSEEIEEYLWTEYLPKALEDIDDPEEMREVGENFYGAIRSYINQRQITDMNNLIEEGHSRARNLHIETDFVNNLLTEGHEKAGKLYGEMDLSSTTESMETEQSSTKESSDSLMSSVYRRARDVILEV